MPSSSGRSLQGPRPHPLKVSKDSWKAGKPPAMISGGGSSGRDSSRQSPMIVYLHSPKVIHAKPQDFMSLVQKLTGKDAGDFPRAEASGAGAGAGASGLELEKEMEGKRELAEEDPLLLTLGQSPSASAWITGSSSMVSPGLFLSSPNLNSCLQEFGSLF